MKIVSLVTGGAGFIGAHVVKQLLVLGHEVVVLDDLSGGFKENVDERATLCIGSITDAALVNELFAVHHFNYVYHLAAYAAEGLSHFIRKFNYENNLLGSINLINAAVNYGVNCFVFTSSIAVYGTNALPLVESHHPHPEDPYGIAKYAVEMDLQNAHDMFGMDFVVFRPHNVYGTHQNIGDKYRNVVGIFMNQILKQEPLTIFGNGEQSRAFTYIDDVAPYIANAVNVPEAYNQVFNIGGDEVVTVGELAVAVFEAMKTEVHIEHLAKRDEVLHAYSDHTKFNDLFKPLKQVRLQEGLLRMAEWVKCNGTRSSKEFGSIEIEKNLPGAWKKSKRNE